MSNAAIIVGHNASLQASSTMINTNSQTIVCNGTLEINGDLFINGSLSFGEVTIPKELAQEFINTYAKNEEMKTKYPAVQAAWDNYQLMLKICTESQ